jgi:hypothetical protein
MTQEQYDAQHEYSEDQAKARHTLFNIALVKSYAYCENYDPHSGRVTEKMGANYLKEGFIDGFLAGFTHRITGD